MKKRIVMIFLACTLTLAAVGCGKSNKTDKSSKTEASNKTEKKDKKEKTVEVDGSKVKLGQYKGIEVSPVEEVEWDDTILDMLTAQNLKAYLEDVTGRPAQEGDTVNISYVGKIDGVEFEGGTGKQELVLGSGTFIPGFEEQVVGFEIGEEKDIQVTFPEDYAQADYAGKEAVFTVTLESIKNVPELTDELAAEISDSKYKTVDEYKNGIKEEYMNYLENNAKNNQRKEAIQKVLENSEVESLSDSRLEKEKATLKENDEKAAAEYGMEYDEYIKRMFGLGDETENGEDSIEDKLKERAEKSAKEMVIFEAIVKKEKLELTDKEYEEQSKKFLDINGSNAPSTLEELESEYGKDYLKTYFQIQKVVDFVLENSVETKEESTQSTTVDSEKETKTVETKVEETKEQ